MRRRESFSFSREFRRGDLPRDPKSSRIFLSPPLVSFRSLIHHWNVDSVCVSHRLTHYFSHYLLWSVLGKMRGTHFIWIQQQQQRKEQEYHHNNFLCKRSLLERRAEGTPAALLLCGSMWNTCFIAWNPIFLNIFIENTFSRSRSSCHSSHQKIFSFFGSKYETTTPQQSFSSFSFSFRFFFILEAFTEFLLLFFNIFETKNLFLAHRWRVFLSTVTRCVQCAQPYAQKFSRFLSFFLLKQALFCKRNRY